MTKEKDNSNKFLLLSLDDKKAKGIANILGNESCKKILDYLSDNESTESKIAKELNIPISTVHYNIQQLLELKLIDWEKYHYSEKGREVKHYKIANKYVIIAPKGDTSSIREKLKTIIPLFGLLLIGAAFITKFFYNNVGDNSIRDSAMISAKAMPSENLEAIAYDEMSYQAVDLATQSPSLIQTILSSNITWFILGFISAFLIFILIKIYLKRKR